MSEVKRATVRAIGPGPLFLRVDGKVVFAGDVLALAEIGYTEGEDILVGTQRFRAKPPRKSTADVVEMLRAPKAA